MSDLNPVTNFDDVIDSRDVIDRIEYLTNLPMDEITEDEESELTALTELAEAGSCYAEDWSYGATLIRDSYFQTYAEELADDLSLLAHEGQWPYTCIDWEAAARGLQQDYTSITFDGIDYWVR